jgi:hypothetical protein
VSTPREEALEKLDRRQVPAALALPGAAVRCELHEGQLAALYLTLAFVDRWRSPSCSCIGSPSEQRSCPMAAP